MTETVWFLAWALVLLAVTYIVVRGWRTYHPRPAPPIFYGRQQIRAAAREEAGRALGGTPVKRSVRRQAARDIARKL